MVGTHTCHTFLVSEVWLSGGMCLQVVQRPHWRRRVAESGVVRPLVALVQPQILTISPGPLANEGQDAHEIAGYNMLLQTLLTLNWCALRPHLCCWYPFRGS